MTVENTSFIATKELGKLAKWLRVLGYDCVYYNDTKESNLIIQALRDRRILLTRTARLTSYKGIRAIVINDDHVENQVEQVIRELGLPLDEEKLFQRCVECNSMLSRAEKDDIKEKVPEYVFDTQEEFKECVKCGKIFWKGTHWDNVEKKFKELRKRRWRRR